jgi:hypothetical protein
LPLKNNKREAAMHHRGKTHFYWSAVLFSLVFTMAGVSAHAGWQYEYVENPKYYYTYSFKLDSNGQPHIVYGGDHLYYATFSGGSWQYQIVDSNLSVGGPCSLTFEAPGQPAILYPGGAETPLKWARWNGSAWIFETVLGPDDSVWCVSADSSGRPVIAYSDRIDHQLRLARWDGSSWVIESVASDDYIRSISSSISLALDSSDNPLIAFDHYDEMEEQYYLEFARWTGTDWNIEVVDSNAGGPLLVLDSSDDPIIGYAGGDRCTVKLARWAGGTWNIEAVGLGGSYGISIALDSSGHPVLAYSASGLSLARWDGVQWNIETVDSGTVWIVAPDSISFDSSGNPTICYQQGWRGINLKLAGWDGISWNLEIVDSKGDVGDYSSLVFDTAGNPAACYLDNDRNALKFARWNGSLWNIEIVDSVGGYSVRNSLALDSSGYPNISYYDSSGFTALKFARWDGAAWNIMTVSGIADMYNSLAVASMDTAVVAYTYYVPGPHDPLDEGLRLSRWNGTAWQLETVFTQSPDSAVSLALDSSDRPAISYLNNEDLRFVRWDGTQWNDAIVDTDYCSWSTSLALDSSGNPAIGYYQYVNAGLKYAKWNGTEWRLELVDSEATHGGDISLALDSSGAPSVSYFSDDCLKFARWDGSSWGIDVVDCSVNWLYRRASLALDGSGYPAISYYDYQERGLKLARRHDWSDRILRGDSVSALAEVADALLPWHDPDDVLRPLPQFERLFYQVESIERIALVKNAQSIKISRF